MAFRVSVLPNHLPGRLNPFLVRATKGEFIEYNRLVDFMAQGRTTVTRIDILGVIELLAAELRRLLADGKSVKTPMGTFSLLASGSMNSVDDAFLPRDANSGHSVRIHFRPTQSFEQAVLGDLFILRDDQNEEARPSIREVAAGEEEGDGNIRSGRVVQVKGRKLAFDPKDPAQGLFFIDTEGRELRSPFYPLILPSSVLGSVPSELPAGSYALAIRSTLAWKDLREDRVQGIVISV